MIMNGIQVYKMTNGAYNYFRKNAKHCNDKSKNFVERKLSSLIYNATNKVYLEKSYFRYSFCGFLIVVDENKKVILKLSWRQNNHDSAPPTKELQFKVRDTNIALGLDRFGNNWLSN